MWLFRVNINVYSFDNVSRISVPDDAWFNRRHHCTDVDGFPWQKAIPSPLDWHSLNCFRCCFSRPCVNLQSKSWRRATYCWIRMAWNSITDYFVVFCRHLIHNWRENTRQLLFRPYVYSGLWRNVGFVLLRFPFTNHVKCALWWSRLQRPWCVVQLQLPRKFSIRLLSNVTQQLDNSWVLCKHLLSSLFQYLRNFNHKICLCSSTLDDRHLAHIAHLDLQLLAPRRTFRTSSDSWIRVAGQWNSSLQWNRCIAYLGF